MGANEIIPETSLETAPKVAGYIESLGRKELEPRKSTAKTAANATS